MPYRYFILLITFATEFGTITAKDNTPLRTHTDLPYLNKDKKVQLDLFYKSDSLISGNLNIELYKFSASHDSNLILSKHNIKTTFQTGNNKRKLTFYDNNSFYDPTFYEILKRTKNVPPGVYKIYLTVKSGQSFHSSVYLREVDSLLKPGGRIKKDIDKNVSTKATSSSHLHSASANKIKAKTTRTPSLTNRKRKIDRYASKRGLTTAYGQKGSKSYVDLFYSDWFVGRYEIDTTVPLSQQFAREEKLAQFPQTPQGLSAQPSLFFQYKTHNTEKKEQQEVKGDIGITTNTSTGQEEYSGVDNNYYEVRGQIEFPVKDVPIIVDGFYTSQDKNRKIKSSYVHAHYDVDKVKSELKKSINSYNSKFEESKSKGLGMESIYGAAIRNLEGQKSALENEIRSEKGTDSSNGQLLTKQQGINELNQKIERYKLLLAQNKNTLYFDSSRVYSKTKDINKMGDLSQKQLLKKGEDLFPDNKAGNFISGITHFDAGMFSKAESRYTMDGQMAKGADVGYDLGFCEASAAAGKTEYIGRDGNLDKYTFYSGKASFRPGKNQKASLLYYGYTPDRKMVAGDAFFSNMPISTPTFSNPVHIISTNYSCNMSDFLAFDGEVATSMRRTEHGDVIQNVQQKDKLAYHFNAEGSIPNTAINLNGVYEKTGKNFENSTLPVSLSGTEQYKLAGRDDFFHSFLTIGIEFDRLIQSSALSNASNTKWGFDAKTNSKRYPSVAISYKPFTTFRSFTDTLNVQQRPLVGSVKTAKATYAIKKHKNSFRFAYLYTECKSIMDTATYGSTLSQLSCVYSNKRVMQTTNVGTTEMTGTNVQTIGPNKTTFLNVNTNYIVNERFSVSTGQDFGVAIFGLCKYGANAGMMWRMHKVPLVFKVNFRYTTYELSQGTAWKNIYAGVVDVDYQFKFKKNNG